MVDLLSFMGINIGLPILVVFVIFFSIWIARAGRMSDVFRDKGTFPSLFRFQAVLWTLVFAYTILSILFVGVFTSIKTPSIGAASNYTTTLLLGALTSAAFGQYLSENKYQAYYTRSFGPNAQDFDTDVAGTTKGPNRPRRFITMLMEDGKYSITRVQLYAWTWIALFVYVLTFFLSLSAAFAHQDRETVSLPDIDHNLLVLSGISQAGFVAGKVAVKPADANQAGLPAKTTLFT